MLGSLVQDMAKVRRVATSVAAVIQASDKQRNHADC